MSSTRILILAALVMVAAAAVVRWRQQGSGVYVIGERMAAAQERDRLHMGGRDTADSPLPAERYDPSRGELGLLNPVPVPLDSAIARAVRRYAAADDAGRARMRDAVGMDGFYELRTFARRAAVFALRERGEQHLRDGLAAVAMMDPSRMDERDVPDVVALLHHAATRIGADAPGLLREAGALARPDVRELLTGFPRRPATDRELSSWLLAEVRTSAGPGFVGYGIDEYQPTLDLVSAIVEIAGVLARDEYQPGDRELAATLPPVWLQPAGGRAVEEALDAAHGGATLHASLRPGTHPRPQDQSLMVFLVEVADEQAARTLLDASRRVRKRDTALLGVAEGRLFALVVGRSFVDGVRSYESTERLARFAAPLGDVLRRHAVER